MQDKCFANREKAQHLAQPALRKYISISLYTHSHTHTHARNACSLGSALAWSLVQFWHWINRLARQFLSILNTNTALFVRKQCEKCARFKLLWKDVHLYWLNGAFPKISGLITVYNVNLCYMKSRISILCLFLNTYFVPFANIYKLHMLKIKVLGIKEIT